jgi:hypothetical protein
LGQTSRFLRRATRKTVLKERIQGCRDGRRALHMLVPISCSGKFEQSRAAALARDSPLYHGANPETRCPSPATERRPMIDGSRRKFIFSAAAMWASMSIGDRRVSAAQSEVHFDFARPLEGWQTVTGKCAIEETPGAAQGGRALVQRATENAFNVIIAPGGPYTNVDGSTLRADVRTRGRFGWHRVPLLRRSILRNPRECSRGQFRFVLLRSRPPRDRSCEGEGSRAWPVAQIAPYRDRRSHRTVG